MLNATLVCMFLFLVSTSPEEFVYDVSIICVKRSSFLDLYMKTFLGYIHFFTEHIPSYTIAYFYILFNL